MCAWIDDAQARLNSNPPLQRADELENLHLGFPVLLEGACKIIVDLELCVQFFEAKKVKTVVLEKRPEKDTVRCTTIAWTSTM